uniref:leucine-rich repeat domain-containing protein n=1 Tax=Treponema saccharophilum TaxID=165 RepID=UPI00386EF1B9
KVNASYLGETYDAEWILDCSRSISNAAFYISTMTSSGTVAVEGSPSGDDLWTLNSAIRNVASGVKVTLDLSGTNLTELCDTAHNEAEPKSFLNCKNLVGIILPNTLTKIGDCSFRWSGITSIDIPSSVTTIGYCAFFQSKLTSITIPDTVTEIKANCNFYKITSLKTAVLNCKANIPDNCFNDCSGLTTVTISSNVKQIGEECFKGCSKLTTINYTGTKAQWNALTKKTDWNNSVPATVVHCSDGNVAL